MIYQKAFLLFGTGHNGKTTLLNLLQKLVGEENCSGVDLSYLSNPFLFAELENRLLNVVSDIDGSGKLKIRTFKQYVGNELQMLINRKYKEPYLHKPTAKLIYSCNTNLPTVPHDTDNGFWRKWIKIECPNEFYDNADLHLFEKLIHENELSGLLNKALEGLDRLNTRGGFEDKYNDIEELREFWMMKENIFLDWVKERCISGEEEWCDKDKAHKEINKYLTEKHKRPITKTKLTQLINLTEKYGSIRKVIKGKRIIVYAGFSLKNKEENSKKEKNPTILDDFSDPGRF